MKSLQRQLQLHLAMTLIGVMTLIWLTGWLLPRPFPEFAFWQNNWPCDVLGAGLTDTLPLSHRPQRFRWLFPFLATAGIVVILVIQSIVIRRIFKQFVPIQQELQQLEQGKIAKLSETVPKEISPIVQEFNRLLSLLQERLERSRHSLGNLAHALKGPLNVLMQLLDEEQVGPSQRIEAQLQVERLRQLTERELKRARMAGLGNSAARFDPHEDLPTLVEILKRIHHTSACHIYIKVADDMGRFGDREDMLELLGNLLDNACKWAKSQVSCHLQRNAQGQVCLIIADDGPGCTTKELQQLTQRGIRMDESVEGHGLGLAICKDIAKLYGGHLLFAASAELGGLQVMVTLGI